MNKFEGKIALVAGNLGKIKKDKFKIGLSGIIAKKLIDEGCQVCIVDNNFTITKACAKEINNEKLFVYECDFFAERTYDIEDYINERNQSKERVVWKHAPVLKMVENIAQKFGKLDILISNFDEFKQARIDKTDEDLYTYLRDQNTIPVLHLLSAVREIMSNQKKLNGTNGKIVFVTSIVGKAGMSLGTMYSAFKGSIVALTKCLAKEFGRFANVNAVSIGPLSEKKMQGPKDRIKKDYLSTQSNMVNTPLTMQDVAPLAVFLASDDACAISGQIMNVDRGMWLKLEA